VITTEKAKQRRITLDDNVRRTLELVVALRHILRRFEVRAICAESMSHVRSASVSGKVSLAWGALITLSAVHELPLLQATPQEVKLRVAGNIKASKPEIAFEVRRKLGNVFEDLLDGVSDGLHEHAYDAAACALACMSDEVICALRRAA